MNKLEQNYIDSPNLTLKVKDQNFAYRDVGPQNNLIPVILLNHWGAVLDNFDPRVVDNISKDRRVIAIDYRGIGASSGNAPLTVGEMADDTVSFIRKMGLDKVILFGFSLGGFVAQDVALKNPELIEKLILAGTGPAGGKGINQVGKISWPLIMKGFLTFKDPKFYLFFTSTANGKKSASDFLARLKERKNNRDKAPSVKSFLRQLKAIEAWGNQSPQKLENIQIPTLIVNGDNDIMVPTINSYDMAKRIKDSELIIYEDAGHGGIFQNYSEFNKIVVKFLEN